MRQPYTQADISGKFIIYDLGKSRFGYHQKGQIPKSDLCFWVKPACVEADNEAGSSWRQMNCCCNWANRYLISLVSCSVVNVRLPWARPNRSCNWRRLNLRFSSGGGLQDLYTRVRVLIEWSHNKAGSSWHQLNCYILQLGESDILQVF